MDEHCHAVEGHPHIYTCENGASLYKTKNPATPYVIVNANHDELLQCSVPHPTASMSSDHAYTCRSVARATSAYPFPRTHVYGLSTGFFDVGFTIGGYDGSRRMVLHRNASPTGSP